MTKKKLNGNSQDHLTNHYISRLVKKNLSESEESGKKIVCGNLLSLANDQYELTQITPPSDGRPISRKELAEALIKLHCERKMIDLTARNIDSEEYLMLGLQAAGEDRAREKRTREAHRYHMRSPHAGSGIRELCSDNTIPRPRGHGYGRVDD